MNRVGKELSLNQGLLGVVHILHNTFLPPPPSVIIRNPLLAAMLCYHNLTPSLNLQFFELHLLIIDIDVETRNTQLY